MAKSLSIFLISALICIGVPLAWSADFLLVLFVSNISPNIVLYAVYIIPPIVLVRVALRRAIGVEIREKEFSLSRAFLVGLAVLVFLALLAIVSKVTFPFFLGSF